MPGDTQSRPGGKSAASPVMGAVILILCLVILVWFVRGAGDDAPVDGPYAELAEQAGLQVEIEHLEADEDWRERAGVSDSGAVTAPDWLGWLLVPLMAGRFLIWFLAILLVVGLIVLAVVFIRAGGAGRFGGQAAPRGAAITEPDTVATSPVERPLLSLDAILAMDDIAAALGELQRLTLTAAAAVTGIILRKSETAREVLRHLPADWGHRGIVLDLVSEAELVRYAGREVQPERLAELVEAVRPLLRDAEGGT